jgi:hypothetical protein
MQRIVVNVQTGAVTAVDLTPEEIAALPGPQPAPVPQEVSRFQAKEALRLAGLLTQADAIVAASGNATLQNAWGNANSFTRNSPGINALAPALGLDSAGLDNLFRTAAGVVA